MDKKNVDISDIQVLEINNGDVFAYLTNKESVITKYSDETKIPKDKLVTRDIQHSENIKVLNNNTGHMEEISVIELLNKKYKEIISARQYFLTKACS